MPSGVEIERKFLVEELPAELSAYPCEEIEQGYLALDGDVEVRIRRYGRFAFMTIKSGADRMRLEEEFKIDAPRFTALWPLTEGRRVENTRYVIPAAGGVRIELDVYHGQLDTRTNIWQHKGYRHSDLERKNFSAGPELRDSAREGEHRSADRPTGVLPFTRARRTLCRHRVLTDQGN